MRLGSDGCTHGGEHCLACSRPECIWEHADKIYRKRGMATETEPPPKCVIPECPTEASWRATSKRENLSHDFCDQHKYWSDADYYDRVEPL